MPGESILKFRSTARARLDSLRGSEPMYANSWPGWKLPVVLMPEQGKG